MNAGGKSDDLTTEGALDMVSLGGHFASGQPALSLRLSEFHTPWCQSWVFIGRNDAKAETPVLWPPHMKS